MKPLRHVITSFALGAGIWFFTKSAYAGLVCFMSGILVDLDHFIEHTIHFGWKTLSIKNVYKASRDTTLSDGAEGYEKLYLVFHSNEVAILLWIAAICTENIYLIAVALGYSSHLALDAIGNTMHPLSYFVIRRFAKKFRTKHLIIKKP